MNAVTMIITVSIIGLLLFVCWLFSRLFKNDLGLTHLIEENHGEGIDHFDNVVVHEIKYLGGLLNNFLISFSINDKRYMLKRVDFNWLEWPSCDTPEFKVIRIARQIITRYDNDVLVGPKPTESKTAENSSAPNE